MSLVDELDVERRRMQQSKCHAGRLRADDPDLWAEIVEAIDAGHSYVAVSVALKAKGRRVSDSSLARHFRGACKCD